MTEFTPLRGVIPAALLPFDAYLDIDEANLRRHLRWLIDVDGVTGVTVNAHASEVATLTTAEQQHVLDVALDEAGGEVQVVCGVYEDGSTKAAALARAAERAGANALLIFPSTVFDGGSQLRPEIAFGHYATIAEATSLPLVAFVYPAASPLRLATDALVRVCSQIDNVVSVKEWSNDIVAYERNYRAVKQLDKEITVLSSFSRSLYASLCIGADGILSGHGSVIADLHVELFRAVEKGELAVARRIWDRVQPFAEACYADPFLDGHNRMKEVLAMLGRIDAAHVRPPLQPIPSAERQHLQDAVLAADLPRAANHVSA